MWSSRASSNAFISSSQGVGTILDNDPQPSVSIGDFTDNEGMSGPTTFTFTVTLSAVSGRTVSVNYTTANGTATTTDNDYQFATGTVTFDPGQTSKAVTVVVNGDSVSTAFQTYSTQNVFFADGFTDPSNTNNTETISIFNPFSVVSDVTMTYRLRFSVSGDRIPDARRLVTDGWSAWIRARVGEAVVIQKEVVRVAGSASSQLNVGDGLLRDETVRTGLESAARLVMADNTNLSLGPNATLKLDRTVFNDEHTYRDIAVKLTAGAFRFVTGGSEKAAYKITTPLATIGVRGTILDILSQRGQTVVVLQEGASSVCTTSFQCIQLTQPGDTAVITAAGPNGRPTIRKTNTPPWTFAATCAAAAGLCSVTDFAGTPTITPPLDDGSDPTGMLCGR